MDQKKPVNFIRWLHFSTSTPPFSTLLIQDGFFSNCLTTLKTLEIPFSSALDRLSCLKQLFKVATRKHNYILILVYLADKLTVKYVIRTLVKTEQNHIERCVYFSMMIRDYRGRNMRKFRRRLKNGFDDLITLEKRGDTYFSRY